MPFEEGDIKLMVLSHIPCLAFAFFRPSFEFLSLHLSRSAVRFWLVDQPHVALVCCRFERVGSTF